MLETLLLAIAAFVSTNIDDAFVLLAFFGDPKYRAVQVVAGQYLGMAALTTIALAVAFAALALPNGYIGYLGLLPILIGAKRLVTAIGERRRGMDSEVRFEAHGKAIASVASVTIANGGDNIGTYVPLFARQDGLKIALTCAVVLVLTGVWCVTGKLLVSHPVLGRHVRSWGHMAVPFVLMALGIYILTRNGVVHAL